MKNTINVLLVRVLGIIALTAIIGFSMTACGGGDATPLPIIPLPDGNKILVSIAVTTPPTKTAYTIGEALDTTGMVVTATYSDESTAAVTGYTLSGFSSATAGEKTVTVTYEGKTATFTVTVHPAGTTLTGIAVTTPPTKTAYTIGEALDPAGLVVTATYSDGSTQVVTGYTTSGFSSTTAGQKTVTVTYEGKTATFTVTVHPVGTTLTDIAVTTPPTKTTYTIGEALDTAGLVVTATYSDGSTQVVTGYTTSGFSSTTAGQKTVTVTYEGKTATFTVTVNAATLTGIAVTTPPTKTDYNLGEELNTAGMVVTATYSDGSTQAVTGYTTSGYDKNTKGNHKVTVTYQGKTAEFEVNVIDPTLQTVAKPVASPAAGTYTAAQNVTLTTATSGATIYYTTNGTEPTKTSTLYSSAISISATTTLKAIAVKEGMNDSDMLTAVYTITVNKVITSIAVTTPPTKTVYIIGETLNPAGMVVTATYSDGSTQAVTGYTTSGFSSTTAGQKTVTVTYEGKTATFTVTVNKTLTSIAITTQPTKTTYDIGDTLDTAGMVVTATYSDSTTQVVTGYTTSGFSSATAGQKTVTVTYEGKTATFTVTVNKTLTSIAVTTPPTKTVYNLNETLNTAGMVVTATYNDSSTQAVTGYTTSGFDSATAGQKTVTVTYEGKTATFTVTIINISPDNISSVADFALWLSAQPANTAATAYIVKLNVNSDTTAASVYDVLRSNISVYNDTKYVNLDLSGSTITSVSFMDCYNLTGINLPNSVTSIGVSAFRGCTGLTSITIPNSVTSIGTNAFQGCTSLTSITIPFVGGDKTYDPYFGFIFGASSYNNQNTSIPTSLRTVIITGGNSIPNYAFNGCYNLTGINLPNSVTSIGDNAFYNCSGLTGITIPDTVTSIGTNAFYGCSSLTSITIPNGVTSIGNSAFYGCSSLTTITVETANSNYSAENGVLYNKSKTKLIQYPSSKTDTTFTIPNGVTSIEAYAFYNCNSLTSITIPNSVTSIGSTVFSSCKNLASVTFGGTIPSSGFYSYAFYQFGDLRAKFYATDATNGTAGTYTTTAPVSNTSEWTKQP